MSGGSLNYACHEVADIGDRVARKAQTPLHRALATHLDLVAKALHDLEWVLSGDYSEGAEVEAIQACIGDHAELAQLVVEARTAADALNEATTRAGSLSVLRNLGEAVMTTIAQKNDAAGSNREDDGVVGDGAE